MADGDQDGTGAAPLSAEQESADAADLAASLGDLAALVSGSWGLTELLTRVASYAVQAIPGADGAGVMPESSSRLVSLHDPHARPIRKGRLGIPVEFGYKAQVVDNEDGVILDHNVEIANPADAPSSRRRSSGSPAAPARSRAQ